MEKPLPDQRNFLNAVIKTAQYIAGLTDGQNIWRETGKALVNFFSADWVAFGERGAGGEITGRHFTFSDQASVSEDLGLEIEKAVAEVLESGFVTSRNISMPGALSMVFLPVTLENKVTSVMMVGHAISAPFPKELLDVYLAVAGLVGTTAARQATEIKLKKHRRNLERLVKDRTQDLTRTNEHLNQEITERKQAEKALRESEEKYRSMMEAMKDSAYICSPGYRIEYMNPAMIDRLGRDATGEICHKAFYDSDKKCSWCIFDKIRKGVHIDYELAHQKDNRHYSVINSSISHTDGTVSQLTIFHDITKIKDMESQLLKARELESLGKLSGGIAHDFNNLLSVILGNIELAKDEIKPGSTISESLMEAEKASIRAKALTARLITFSKGGSPNQEKTAMGDVIPRFVRLALSGSAIKLEVSVVGESLFADIDRQQIKLVMDHMIANAREAMSGQGAIKVSCGQIAIGKEDALPLPEGEYVRISIKDQGCGISEENLKKIFDPYFSTKEMGSDKGQGLGLAVCHSIIKKHGGFITVTSEIGEGSTFRLYFPASEKKPAAPRAVSKSMPGKPVPITGKILVMDDEEMIRKLIRQMLSRLGYECKVASDGAEAIKIYQQEMETGKPFDVVILDLINEIGMGGMEAMKRLIEIDPGVKGIVSTGYSNDPVVINFAAYGFSGTLSKPYYRAELSKALGEAILGA